MGNLSLDCLRAVSRTCRGSSGCASTTRDFWAFQHFPGSAVTTSWVLNAWSRFQIDKQCLTHHLHHRLCHLHSTCCIGNFCLTTTKTRQSHSVDSCSKCLRCYCWAIPAGEKLPCSRLSDMNSMWEPWKCRREGLESCPMTAVDGSCKLGCKTTQSSQLSSCTVRGVDWRGIGVN